MLDEITAEIKRLLESDAKYRDNDRLLCARIWFNEIRLHKTMTAEKFLMQYAFEKTLTTADTITRTRREIQKQNPHLETEKSKARKLKAKEVKQYLKETDFRTLSSEKSAEIVAKLESQGFSWQETSENIEAVKLELNKIK